MSQRALTNKQRRATKKKRPATHPALSVVAPASAPVVLVEERKENGVEVDLDKIYYLEYERVVPNPNQPRKFFDEEALKGFAESIAIMGVLKPIEVKSPDDPKLQKLGKVIIVDGERRWLAAGMAKLKVVPVRFLSIDDALMFDVSFVSNFSREAMTEIEIAFGLQKLRDDRGYSVEKIAKMVGKSVGWVYNHLKYLELHPDIAALLATRKVAPHIALAIARFPQDKQMEILREIEKKIEKKGGPLSLMEASLFVSGFTHKEGIASSTNSRNRGHKPHGKKVVEQLTRTMENLNSELDHFDELSDEVVEAVGGAVLEKLIQRLERLTERLPEVLKRAQKIF